MSDLIPDAAEALSLAIEEAIEDWQKVVHWYGDPLPSFAIAEHVTAALSVTDDQGVPLIVAAWLERVDGARISIPGTLDDEPVYVIRHPNREASSCPTCGSMKPDRYWGVCAEGWPNKVDAWHTEEPDRCPRCKYERGKNWGCPDPWHTEEPGT